jgi:homoserine kinase type II
MSTPALTSVLTAFNLPHSKIAPQLDGTNTAWFIHHVSGTYIIKCLTYASDDDQRRQHTLSCKVMDHLHTHGFTCPKPLKNRNGEYLTQHDGKYYQALTFIKGQASWDHITLDRLTQAGLCIGQFHHLQQTLPNIPPPADLRARITNSLNRIQAEWNTFGMNRSDIREAAEEALANLDNRWHQQTNLPYGFMHTDATPGNVLFDNNHLTGLIDFELIPGTFLFDLCLSAIRWAGHFDLKTTTNHIEHINLIAFFKAYNKSRPFTPAEKHVVKDLLLLAATWSWGRQRLHKPQDPIWRLTARGEIYLAIYNTHVKSFID